MARNQPRVVYAIARWAELYEPPPKAHRGGRGPLKYYMSRVHPHVWTSEYRRLYGAAAELLLAALGLFVKCCEMAGGEPRGPARDGTVYGDDHMPATCAVIAEENGFPEDLVARCLAALVEAGWVEELPYDEWVSRGNGEWRAAAGGDAGQPATAGDGGEVRAAAGPNENRNRDRNNNENLNRDRNPNGERGTDSDLSSQMDSGSDSAAEGHQGIRSTTVLALAEIFHVRPEGPEDKTRRGQQTRSDITTLRRICEHVITSSAPGPAKEQAADLIALAEEKRGSTLVNKLAGFTKAAKTRWDIPFQRRQRRTA